MNEKKDIFVISDLHMGDGGPRDNFAAGDKEQQLDLFIDFVKKENGELIIVGDLFEFWQASLGKVLVMRRPLIDRLSNMGATFVIGNHDSDLEALIGSDILGPRFFKKDRIAKKLSIYDDDDIEHPATLEEIEGLECAAVWEPQHVVDRLNDHFEGRPNKWVDSLLPDENEYR